MDDEKKIKLSTLIYAVLIVIVIAIGICSILAYGTQTEAGKKIYTGKNNKRKICGYKPVSADTLLF